MASSIIQALQSKPDLVNRLKDDAKKSAAKKAIEQGDVHGALAALCSDPNLVADVAELLSDNAALQSATGIPKEQLKTLLTAAGAAMPDAMNAIDLFSQGRWKEGLAAFAKAGAQAKPLFQQMAATLANRISADAPGASVIKAMLTNPAVVGAILDAAGDDGVQQAFEELTTGDPAKGFAHLAANPKVQAAVGEAVSGIPEVKKAMTTLGVPADAQAKMIKDAVAAIPELMAAAQAIEAKKWGEAGKHLLAAVPFAKVPIKTLAKNVADKFPDDGPTAYIHALLSSDKVIDAVVDDPAVQAAIGQIIDGHVPEGVEALVKNKGLRDAVVDALAQGVLDGDPKVASILQSFNITSDDLKKMADAAPEVIEGVKALLKTPPDYQNAVPHFWKAAKKEKGLAAKAMAGLAQRVAKATPQDGALGTMLSVLSSEKVLDDIMSSAPQVVKDLDAGQIAQAVNDVFKNPTLTQDVGDALSKDENAKKALEKIGLEPSDLPNMGKAIADAVHLSEVAAGGDIAATAEAFFTVIQDLPEKVKAQVVGKIIAKLKLPNGVAKLVSSVSAFVTNPKVMENIKKAISAFKDHKPVEFAEGILDALQAGATDETATKNFLDSLGSLDGSIGKLFKDPRLNELIAKSGAIGPLVQEVKDLLQGDFKGALGELWNSLNKLVKAPSNDPAVRAQQEKAGQAKDGIPFTADGLEAVIRMVARNHLADFDSITIDPDAKDVIGDSEAAFNKEVAKVADDQADSSAGGGR